jgi:hypothetical protein
MLHDVCNVLVFVKDSEVGNAKCWLFFILGNVCVSVILFSVLCYVSEIFYW